jgi:hypothetical protein
VQPQAFTLGRHVSALLERLLQQGKVRRLEQGRGRTDRVRGVGDDDVVLVFVLGQELESITDKDGHARVREDGRHVREVLLGDTDDGLVNVAQGDVLDGLVLEDFTNDTAVAAADDEDVFRVRVGGHGQVGDHFLVTDGRRLARNRGVTRRYSRKLVSLGALDDTIEDQDVSVRLTLEHEHVLVLGLLHVEDLVDLQGECLSGPLRVDLAEPAVNDGGVSEGSHFGVNEAWREKGAGEVVECASYHDSDWQYAPDTSGYSLSRENFT